jgi:hypothetical protein
MIHTLRHLDDDRPINWAELLRAVNGSLTHRAQQLAGAMQSPPATAEDVLGTTLVIAIVIPNGSEATVELVQIGDSEAWLLGPGGRFSPLLAQKTSAGAELMGSAVTGIPREPVIFRHQHAVLAKDHVLLLGTDGFGDPLGDGTGLVGELFARELATIPRPLRFAHLLDFSRETFDDDRTLIAVWPTSSQGRHTR